jgi:glycosyltransferase involved in cell wall biosynthesis
LAIRIKESGHNVAVLAGSGEEEPGLSIKLERKAINLYKVPYVDAVNFSNLTRSVLVLAEIIRMENIDLIHANGIIHMLLAFFASKSSHRKVKIAVTLHTTLHGTPFETLAYVVFAGLMNICADIVIPVARVVGVNLRRFGMVKKMVTVHNGIDLESFQQIMRTHGHMRLDLLDGPRDSIVTIGYFANLIPRKGHVYLLQAVSSMLKQNRKVRLILTGEGPLKEKLEVLSERLGIGENIIFTGKIRYQQLYQLLNFIDIYVFPSLSELFPFAILEAMAAAKPIVATNVGGISEAIKNEENGLLVPPKDARKLAEAIKSLIDNPQRALAIGNEARETIKKFFNMDRIARRLVECYMLARAS